MKSPQAQAQFIIINSWPRPNVESQLVRTSEESFLACSILAWPTASWPYTRSLTHESVRGNNCQRRKHGQYSGIWDS